MKEIGSPYELSVILESIKHCGFCCETCANWTPPYDFQVEDNNFEGVCSAIQAAGGAFHSAGTYADDFCTYFEHKPQSNG